LWATRSSFSPRTRRSSLAWRTCAARRSTPTRSRKSLRAVVGRTEAASVDARTAALEWFDAGYLIETYRQLGLVYEYGMLPRRRQEMSLVPPELETLDGYALVEKALVLAAAAAELELAASLMTR
jgi:hypothetical protein